MMTTRLCWTPILLLGMVGCLKSEESNPSFLSDFGTCQLTSTGTVGGVDGNWVGCRALFSGSPSNVLTINLATPFVSGSFIAPGQGWLAINVSSDSLENTTLVIDDTDASTVPISVQPDRASLYYFDQQGRKVFARGSLAVGRNTVFTNLQQVVFEANLEGVTVDLPESAIREGGGSSLVPTSLGGSIQLAPATGEDDPGGGGTANCDGLTQQCSEGGQAPCYCAAACVCHNAGDTACESQNRQSAMQLGTTCSY